MLAGCGKFKNEVASGARDMAEAVEIQLPINALTHNQTPLTALIEHAASGDKAAFDRIMIHSQQRVMAMTWRLLGNDADARDASQEVFLRVYKYLGSFKQDQDFFAWVYTIAVNVCRDIAKKRAYHNDTVVLEPDTAEEAWSPSSNEESADDAAIRAEERELIAKAMATLPYKERASIVLRDVEGYSTNEVALIMNSSATTVRSQISSARRKIRIYCEQHLKRRERGGSHGL